MDARRAVVRAQDDQQLAAGQLGDVRLGEVVVLAGIVIQVQDGARDLPRPRLVGGGGQQHRVPGRPHRGAGVQQLAAGGLHRPVRAETVLGTGGSQVPPPSVERRVQLPSQARRVSSGILLQCRAHAPICAGVPRPSSRNRSKLSQVALVNQLITSVPEASSMMPASRSSSGVLLMITGSVQVSPRSPLLISSVLPYGQTCSSRSPEKTTRISPLARVTAVGHAR